MEKPIYQRIMDILRDEIDQMEPNSPILSERELEKKLGASRMTIRKAIEMLVEEGVLYRIQNVGTFVSDQKLHKKVPSYPLFQSFNADDEYKIIYFDVKDGGDREVSNRLEIDFLDQFVRIVRLNLKDGKPESLDQIYIARLMVDDNVMSDIVRLLRFSANIETGSVNQTFVPMMVPVVFANLLKLKINTPIIRIDSTIVTKSGKVYAFIQSYVNPLEKEIEITI